MLTTPRSRWSVAETPRGRGSGINRRRKTMLAGCPLITFSVFLLLVAPAVAQTGLVPIRTAAPTGGVSAVQTVQHVNVAGQDGRLHAMPTGQQRLDVIARRSQLIVTRDRVRRIHISDPSILEVVQFTETEFSLIGLELGVTDMTFWFEGSDQPSMYVVRTIPDPSLEEQRRLDYGKIEQKLTLLYPNSKVYLIPMSQKIIVRGQAKDAQEAARIMQIVRGEVLTQEGNIFAGYATDPGSNGSQVATAGFAGGIGTGYGDLLSSYIVNELQVPGEFQIKIRVRIADLNRSQLRRLGVDWSVAFNDARHVVASGLGGAAGVLSGVFSNGDITVLLDALASNGTAKILEDAVVITMSGNPASFLSGGEFAVPNTVGNNGVLVGTTTFRGFGTSIITTPTIIDDDLIRLQIVPELSAINSGNAVGGVPGVDVRRVQTLVELREGQTIVLGGLFSRRQQAEVTRVPLLGEIPIVGSYLFNSKQATEDETELLIVVTPEIVRPMDPDEVPPLPGFYVTHPDDFDFYKFNRTEGNPDLSHYRLLPYGNGNGYGEDVGFGFHNPQYGSCRYSDAGVTGGGYMGGGYPGSPTGNGYVPVPGVQPGYPQQQQVPYQPPMNTGPAPPAGLQPTPSMGVPNQGASSGQLQQPFIQQSGMYQQHPTIQQMNGPQPPMNQPSERRSAWSPMNWFKK